MIFIRRVTQSGKEENSSPPLTWRQWYDIRLSNDIMYAATNVTTTIAYDQCWNLQIHDQKRTAMVNDLAMMSRSKWLPNHPQDVNDMNRMKLHSKHATWYCDGIWLEECLLLLLDFHAKLRWDSIHTIASYKCPSVMRWPAYGLIHEWHQVLAPNGRTFYPVGTLHTTTNRDRKWSSRRAV